MCVFAYDRFIEYNNDASRPFIANTHTHTHWNPSNNESDAAVGWGMIWVLTIASSLTSFVIIVDDFTSTTGYTSHHTRARVSCYDWARYETSDDMRNWVGLSGNTTIDEPTTTMCVCCAIFGGLPTTKQLTNKRARDGGEEERIIEWAQNGGNVNRFS